MQDWNESFREIERSNNPTSLDNLFISGNSLETLAEFQIPYPEDAPDMQGWRNAVAEWLYWLHCQDFVLPANKDDFLQDHPFGTEMPSLQELLSKPGATAVFPLLNEKGKPTSVRIYLTQMGSQGERDMASQLPGDSNLEGLKTHRVFFHNEGSCRFEGNSWQLAAALAMAALDEANGTHFKRELAQNWIITGSILPNNKIGRIEVGNKHELRGKTFLFPEANRADFSSEKVALYRFADSLSQAKSIIREDAIQGGKVTLPTPIQELHMLVGGSPAPILSCGFQLYAQNTILWASSETKDLAEKLASIFNQHGLTASVKTMENSGEIDILYKKFCEEFKHKEGFVLNATGGNRLMSWAALFAARQSGKVSIVYRDIDAKPYHLQVMNFQGDQIINEIQRVLRCPDEVGKKINWNLLYTKGGVKEENLNDAFYHSQTEDVKN